MEIPDFTNEGVLPVGIYKATIEEARERFCSIENLEHRKKLFNNFLKYLECIEKYNVKYELYMDGSFVTNKEFPSDIDVLLIYDIEYLNQEWLTLINEEYVKIHFGGIQIIPSFLETFSGEETIDWAQDVKDKPGKRKGIVRVIL
jgi:hypothetical protein